MKNYPIGAKELKVIKILDKKKAATAKEIARYMNVTSRTVLNYIKNINGLMGKEVVEIRFRKDRKYIMRKIDTEKFQKIMDTSLENDISIPEERIREIIKVLILEKQLIQIEDLAERFYISRTTLIKDLKKVSKILKNYEIELKGKPNGGIKAVGNEMNIRFCISEILYKRENEGTEIGIELKKFIKHWEIIEKILKRIFKKTNFKLSEENFKNLIIHISIAIERFKSGNEIREISEKVKNANITKEYKISSLIGEEIEKEINLNLPKQELMYICLHLLGRKPVKEMIESENGIEIKPLAKKIVLKVLDEIYKYTGFFMKDDKEFIWGLEIHINFVLNRIMFNMNIRNPLFKEVKKKFPFEYELAAIGASAIEKELNVKVDEHEISYLAMHVVGYIERNNFKYKDIKRVALICGTGLGTAQLMLIKIKNVLGELENIKTFSSSYLEPEVLEEFDIIFTTIDLDINVSTPIIKLNVLFDERDLQNKIAYRKIKEKISQNDSYVLKMLFHEELFFKINLEDPEEIIKYMARKCISRGVADEDFEKRLLERERLSPTSFDNLVALPHAINYKSDEIKIALGILRKTVKWDKNPVRIVFMVLVPHEIVEDVNLFIRVYEDILKVGQNTKLLQKMAKVKNFKELISLF
ncbi:BglG family transcription antiterminator [Maledivibacter halophilus]|uniref:Lichenan operon transcriptional antiterminator n=1 Tax=Maledivibacter halophilus TaxID=36842 RepID=A0A1T5M938_9FIRM|nr:BglG family transcription antiterminator [Maledivibacter halophilus]SKC84379.1 lichenan operon transcriptional antiterminator [Maledivibacter halophilus]